MLTDIRHKVIVLLACVPLALVAACGGTAEPVTTVATPDIEATVEATAEIKALAIAKSMVEATAQAAPTSSDTAVRSEKPPLRETTPDTSPVPIDKFFLELVEPSSLDIVVNESTINVKGRTRIDALVTVNDYVVEPDIEGWFQQKINLESGLNIIEIIASVATGEQESLLLGVGYVSK